MYVLLQATVESPKGKASIGGSIGPGGEVRTCPEGQTGFGFDAKGVTFDGCRRNP